MADGEEDKGQDGADGADDGAGAITLESVDAFDADNLSVEQTKFLEDNKGDLTPEQQTKFGIKAEDKADDTNLDDLEPETRGAKAAKEEKKEKKDDAAADDDDDLDPDDEKMVSKVLNKRLGPVQEQLKELQGIKDQNEVNAFLRQNPDYAKYEGVALKYMAHPAYKNIPVKNIMAIVAASGLQKMGAQKEREAAKKAKETQGNGTQVRKPAAGKPDYKNMSKEEFEAAKAAVLQGPRN